MNPYLSVAKLEFLSRVYTLEQKKTAQERGAPRGVISQRQGDVNSNCFGYFKPSLALVIILAIS
jgi:hypothetical protein